VRQPQADQDRRRLPRRPPILNAVMSGIHDRHVGSASGVLTTMLRGGNALGVAALEVLSF
jgi:hypothetical protein